MSAPILKNLALALALLSPAWLNAQPVIVDSKPAEVVVYPDSARIIRTGSKTFAVGEATVLFENIPLSANEQSLRLKAKGPKGTRLFGVRLRQAFSDQTLQEKSLTIEKQISDLQDQKMDLQDSIDSRNGEITILKALATQSAQGAGASAAVLKDMVDAAGRAGSRIEILVKRSRKDQRAQRDLDNKIAALKMEQSQIGTGNKSMLVAEADLDLATAGEVKFELSYLAGGAGWTPVYDLRLDSTAGDPKVSVHFQGQVTQKTGEDWTGVKLTLSTTRPQAGTSVPDPTHWWLDYQQIYPVQARQMMSLAKSNRPMAAPAAEAMAMDRGSMVTEPSYYEAEQVQAAVQALSFSTAFEIKRRKDIPSDGQNHRVTVSEDQHPAALLLVSVPRLDPAVYIEADIKYGGEAPLLPGIANLFRDDSFVGSSWIQQVAPGEQFKLGFGRDELVKVERKLMDQKSGDKGFVFKDGQRKYHWATTISNYHAAARVVEVRQQLPRSKQKDIEVEAGKITPDPLAADDAHPGLYKWKLELKPKEKKEIHFKYEVKWPKSQRVTGME